MSQLAETEFIAFDLETTGLHPISCRIVEIGAVRFRGDGELLATYETLVNPGCPIPPRVTAVHGITNIMVRRKPAIHDVLPEFLDFLGDPRTLLMAHHASFDLGLLNPTSQWTGQRPTAVC